MIPHQAQTGWRLATLWAGLWWGAITALAFVAVPMLFAKLGSPAVAGPVAAAFFSVVCKLSLLSAAILLVFFKRFKPLTIDAKGFPAPALSLVFLAVAACAALLQDFWVAHQIITARATGGNLPLWHGLGSVLVLVQWLCAGAVLWRLTGHGPVALTAVQAAHPLPVTPSPVKPR
jgi:hypothetical protein